MKSMLLAFLLFLGLGGLQKISLVNEHSQKAAEAFKKGNFAAAIKSYEYLVYETGDKDPRILLNLAHAYRLNNQAEKAATAYQKCTSVPEARLRSVAWEQLGTLETKIQNYREALTYYKRALVANPQNEQARYNYELLKKYLQKNPEAQKQLPPPNQEKKEKQEQEKKEPQKQEPQQQKPNPQGNEEKETQTDKQPGNQQQQPEKQTNPKSQEPQQQEKPEGENGKEKEQKTGKEKGNEQGQDQTENEPEKQPEKPNKAGGKDAASGRENRLQTQYERLRKANISPEQAEQMLNAMRAAEQQYLQQVPKAPTRRRNSSKPDW